MLPGAPSLISPLTGVPHPSLFSSEGWETSTLNRPVLRVSRLRPEKQIPSITLDALCQIWHIHF
jgi:hypothetical protein